MASEISCSYPGLYTDNLNLTVERFGKVPYIIGNIALLSGLTLLFKLDFLEIQWVGALAIAIILSCFVYILKDHLSKVSDIERSPKANKIDFTKIELLD
ncbi:hypothetical protein GCM10011607_05990 [Shewanella inventionis]|uniref:Uncharacterized protein n=1 Tax=Shewanella inventionis TaxID=1738770 RepID=A0ABQ1IQA6_9GAMM|nr:hypothetical protein GCM10011607_05990 [Shewanella inventionis]